MKYEVGSMKQKLSKKTSRYRTITDLIWYDSIVNRQSLFDQGEFSILPGLTLFYITKVTLYDSLTIGESCLDSMSDRS